MPFNPVTGAFEPDAMPAPVEGVAAPSDGMHPLNPLLVAGKVAAAPVYGLGKLLTADHASVPQPVAVGPDGQPINPISGMPVGSEGVAAEAATDSAPVTAPPAATPAGAQQLQTGLAAGVNAAMTGAATDSAPTAPTPAPQTAQQPQGGSMSSSGGMAMGGLPAGLPARIAGKDPTNFGQTPTEQGWHPQVYGHMLNQAAFQTEEAANQADLASKQSAAYADAATKYSALLDEQKQREAERQMWVQSAIDKHEQIANNLARQEIDPDHFFTSKGTAGSIMAGLGMAFSGVGDAILMAAGHQGGGHFMERAMNFVDRDIAVQKANIQLKRDAFGAQMGVYAERYRAFGDERVAEASARATIFDWLGMQAKSYQAQAFESTTKLAVGQIAEQLLFQANQYKNGITIASEHAYEDDAARRIAAYMQQVAAYNAKIQAAREEERKAVRDVQLKMIEKEGIPQGGLHLGVFPAGHPSAGQYGWQMAPKPGESAPYMQGIGGPNMGGAQGGGMGAGNIILPKGIKPGTKEAAEYTDKAKARLVGVPMPDGSTVNVAARSEHFASKLGPALMEAQSYADNIQLMMRILDDPKLTATERYTMYNQAFNSAGGSYKAIHQLGAYDLGVQNLVKGSLPSYGDPFGGALFNKDTARKKLSMELDQAYKLANRALVVWGDPEVSGALPKFAPAGDVFSKLGAVRADKAYASQDMTDPGINWGKVGLAGAAVAAPYLAPAAIIGLVGSQ